MEFKSPDLPTSLLALLNLIATYLTFLVWTPPNANPTPKGQPPTDRLFHVKAPYFISARRFGHLFLGLYQTLLILTNPTPPSLLCPHPESLNPSIITWSPLSILSLSFILIFAPLRLLTFSTLGKNFTFKLAPPKKLVTTGIYRYMQHPSYVANGVVFFANAMLVERPDGVAGCFLRKSWVDSWVWYLVGVGGVFVVLSGIKVRVQDEEKMLKEAFGEEWEVWHRKTARFVPGLF